MYQKTVVHLHNEILHSRKKKGGPSLRNSMDGTGEHYAKRNKPGGKRQIPYVLTYKRKLIDKTNKRAGKKEPQTWKLRTNWDRQEGWREGIILERGRVKEHVQWTHGIVLEAGVGQEKGERWGGAEMGTTVTEQQWKKEKRADFLKEPKRISKD